MAHCLFTAAFYSDTRELKNALSSGQDPNVINENGCSAMHIAAANGNIDVLKILLENEVCINQPDVTGCTPLHLAARNGHLPTIKWLVSKGGDIKVKSNKGHTALEVALAQSDRQGQRDVISYLRKCGREKMAWEPQQD